MTPKRWLGAFIFSGFLLTHVAVAGSAAPGYDGLGGVSITAANPSSEDWRARRAHFAQLILGAKSGDMGSRVALDQILTDFERTPLKLTPPENLDILGAFYIPKEGVSTALPIVVMNQVLGWYDALRFGTESGRQEIVQNEGFFKRPFAIAGPDSIKQMSTLMKEHPDQVEAAVREGITFAEKNRDTHLYDSHWPAAYGLERTICAQGGNCTAPAALPQDKWADAWQTAKQRVLAYYVPAATGAN